MTDWYIHYFRLGDDHWQGKNRLNSWKDFTHCSPNLQLKYITETNTLMTNLTQSGRSIKLGNIVNITPKSFYFIYKNIFLIYLKNNKICLSCSSVID